MTELKLDISMSLDGFVAGPNQTLDGRWATGASGCTSGSFGSRAGASPTGSRAATPTRPTHRPRETAAKEGGTSFTFLTDGVEAALEQARAAAGDKDVYLAGGANVAQQYLQAGLLDELQIHVVPVFLGAACASSTGLGSSRSSSKPRG